MVKILLTLHVSCFTGHNIGVSNRSSPVTRVNIMIIIFSAFIAMTARLVYPQAQERDQTIKLSAELVVLDVHVVNKKTGSAVSNLKKEDFSIYEDGVRQQIIHFSQDALPLSIVLLLDVSGSVLPIMKQIRDLALEALQHLKPEDEIALMVFARRAKLIQDFTKDRQLIVDQIKRVNEEANVGGSTFINDGVYQAAVHLRSASNPSSRRVVMVITDNISNQPFFIGPSEQETLHELFENGGVVCGIFVESRFSKVEGATNKSVFFWRKVLYKGNINIYANETGGLVLRAKKGEVGEKLTDLIDQLRTRYTLGYMPTNRKRDGKFRKIKVLVSPEVEEREGELAVLARRGYYAK